MLEKKIVAVGQKVKKEDSAEAPKEKSTMEVFKLHIGCIDPLSKAIQSMKDCYADIEDDSLKSELMSCIESVGKIEERLLAKASEALRGEIESIRGGETPDLGGDVASLAAQIAGKAPIAAPAVAKTEAPSVEPQEGAIKPDACAS